MSTYVLVNSDDIGITRTMKILLLCFGGVLLTALAVALRILWLCAKHHELPSE